MAGSLTNGLLLTESAKKFNPRKEGADMAIQPKTGILRRYWTAFLDLLNEFIPTRVHLRDSAEQMLSILDVKADAVSFAMAQADQSYENLQAEVLNHEGLSREATHFLREKNEAAAKRCLALKLQSEESIKRLKTIYGSRQQEAEAAVVAFRTQKKEVEERVAKLPELEHEVRLIEMQEQIQKKEQRLSLEAPRASFDGLGQGLEIKKAQLRNRELLLSDPNAKLDLEIKEASEHRRLEEAFEKLKQQVGFGEGSAIEAEFSEDTTVSDAQKLLEAPRYSGLLDVCRPTLAGVRRERR